MPVLKSREQKIQKAHEKTGNVKKKKKLSLVRCSLWREAATGRPRRSALQRTGRSVLPGDMPQTGLEPAETFNINVSIGITCTFLHVPHCRINKVFLLPV